MRSRAGGSVKDGGRPSRLRRRPGRRRVGGLDRRLYDDAGGAGQHLAAPLLWFPSRAATSHNKAAENAARVIRL